MSFHKLLNINVYHDNTVRYRVRYGHDIVNIIRNNNNNYIIEEWGQLMTPLFDSYSNKLVGFVDA